ncbi:MAG: hypothetical protein WCK33_03345 [Phycisphaerae bacterium]
MKNRTKLAIASLVIASAHGLAMADGQVSFTDAPAGTKYDGSGGGAFLGTRVSGDIGDPNRLGLPVNQFYTFCVEKNQSISFGTTYFGQIATSSNSNSSSSNTAGEVRLSNITARLFREFMDGGNFGLVGSFANGYTTAAQTNAIQNAIWAAQGQITLSTLTGDSLALYNWAKNNSNGLKGVRVLRLWTVNNNGVYSGAGQDQLTMVPLPPAAYAGLGTLACLLGAGHIRRRKLAAA